MENTDGGINRVIEVLVKSGHTPKVWIDFIIEREKEIREEALIKYLKKWK